ncbi:Na+/H+ antiporter NhaA [Georgenia deserti]|uniref:Na(+)/H(+) antiporter NhaA n=1 Tax=Georgenia deserti TaxID=2093781 RepID=A0ABW4L6V3_9MICO
MDSPGPGPLRTLLDRLRSETGSALLLLGAAVVALVWANSPLSASYEALWQLRINLEIGDLRFDMDLHHWVNDGLMVAFFFLVGLEVRQELSVGSLRHRRSRLVPLVAGTAGVAAPALIYLVIAGAEAPEGWGVVVGTDTAFLLGVLAIVGPRMSSQLRVFLLTLSVVDDFLAVAIIGVVYSEAVEVMPLVVALACLAALWLLGRTREWRSGPYVLAVVVLWGATVLAGVHPSLAGMAAGLLVPSREPERHDVLRAKYLFRDYWQSPGAGPARSVQLGLARSISVNERLHLALSTPVSLVVVPVFVLANAGIDLRGGALVAALGSAIMWAVAGGLVLGKLAGITVGSGLAVRLGLGRLPDGVGPGSVAGGAALSGIGFTVSLLIIDLAFTDPAQAQAATVGVLLAIVAASLIGLAMFTTARRKGETSADLPTVLTPEVDPGRDHIHGDDDAPITVVEYLDFECPFCARVTGMWADLRHHFGDRIRYVVRHLPLEDVHPRAFGAAVAAEAAARQGRFWDLHDVLFANQSQLEPDDLRGYAVDLGLDMSRFDDDVADESVIARVRADMLSARASGARGTPTFFLNGVRHRGSHDARTLIAALEDARAGESTGPE